MPEMFVVISGGGTSGPCHSFHQKQAQANTAATDNADLIAHVGAVEVGSLVPADAYFDGTSVIPDDAGETAYADARTDTQKLKDAARALHDLYNAVIQAAENHGLADYFPRDHVNWFHDFEIYAHRGSRGVFLSDNLTVDQKLAWAAANTLGPTDIYPAGVALPTFSQIAAVCLRAVRGLGGQRGRADSGDLFRQPDERCAMDPGGLQDQHIATPRRHSRRRNDRRSRLHRRRLDSKHHRLTAGRESCHSRQKEPSTRFPRLKAPSTTRTRR